MKYHRFIFLTFKLSMLTLVCCFIMCPCTRPVTLVRPRRTLEQPHENPCESVRRCFRRGHVCFCVTMNQPWEIEKKKKPKQTREQKEAHDDSRFERLDPKGCTPPGRKSHPLVSKEACVRRVGEKRGGEYYSFLAHRPESRFYRPGPPIS